ncbi:MAG: porin family protein, partial [Hyphomicrobiales bacterium]|nr:porin family protein [Hyphomicrobiales bacterium]
ADSAMRIFCVGSRVGVFASAHEVKLVLVNRTCTLLVVSCVGACFAQAASALEMNSFTGAPQQQAQPDWAGFYLRSNSGAGSDAIPWTTAPTSGFASSNTAPTNEKFGYNFQTKNFVFGLEGSLAAANFDGRFTAPYLPAFTAGGWSPNMNWLGTVTGKFGYSFGQWLPYVKGGFASASVGSPLQGASQLGAFSTGSQGTQLNGWTAGAGFEYQITPKLSLGLEYLYTDFGSGTGNGGAPITGSPEVYSTALKSQSLLGRLNYKAGW